MQVVDHLLRRKTAIGLRMRSNRCSSHRRRESLGWITKASEIDVSCEERDQRVNFFCCSLLSICDVPGRRFVLIDGEIGQDLSSAN
jgi:hypothetical protein